MSPEPDTDVLLVAVWQEWAFVRVLGRGSFKISSALKRFHTAMIERGYVLHALDMADCLGLDSTFMGVLAGIGLRLKRRGEGRLIMVNVNSKINNLLDTLGLTHLISAYAPGDEPGDLRGRLSSSEDLTPLDMPPDDKKNTSITMLDAHEDLIAASPDNLPKFKDVLEYLREDLSDRGTAE
ncbi:MAG: STAS domain-containing protein [Kiritimatiellae bacterium]|nr:STAS domain-containing protein [Kiritimatiellia bacterium]